MTKKKHQEQENDYRFDYVTVRLKSVKSNDAAYLQEKLNNIINTINAAEILLIKSSAAYKTLKDIIEE